MGAAHTVAAYPLLPRTVPTEERERCLQDIESRPPSWQERFELVQRRTAPLTHEAAVRQRPTDLPQMQVEVILICTSVCGQRNHR